MQKISFLREYTLVISERKTFFICPFLQLSINLKFVGWLWTRCNANITVVRYPDLLTSSLCNVINGGNCFTSTNVESISVSSFCQSTSGNCKFDLCGILWHYLVLHFKITRRTKTRLMPRFNLKKDSHSLCVVNDLRAMHDVSPIKLKRIKSKAIRR